MLETVLAIPFWVELVATIAGAVSGSIHAVKHEYDIFGACCVACLTGLAGGIVRDVLLQDHGIYAFQRPELIIACIVTALVVFFFCKLFEKMDLVMDSIDAVSVALYAIIGAGKGLSAGYSILPAAILGTITAVGGGCVRDIILARQPKIFKSGTLYASAGFAGALVFSILKFYEVLPTWNAVIGVVIVLVLRFASLIFGIETHPARDYTDTVIAAMARIKGRVFAKVERHRQARERRRRQRQGDDGGEQGE